MKFQKKDFQFLDIFQTVVDTRSPMNDKFQMKGILSEKKIVCSQVSSDVMLYCEIEKDITEDFSFIFPTVKFNSILKSVDDNSEIDITQKQITFGKSKYEFSTFDYEYADTISIRKAIQDSSVVRSKKTIIDLAMLAVAKQYMGSDINKLDVVGLFNSHFISSDRENVMCAVKSNNNEDTTIYFSRPAVSLLTSSKQESVDIEEFQEQGFYTFKVGTIQVVCMFKEHKLPNIFDEGIKKVYDHDTKCVVKRADIIGAFNRIKIVSAENINSRVVVSLENNTMSIESKDVNYAKEEISASYDKELEGHYFIISSTFISSIISSLKSDESNISINPDKENAVAIKITDPESTKFFAHTLCEYD